MTNDEKWSQMFENIMAFLEQHKRRPSKYYAEDRDMHNWLKYNKKLLKQEKMPDGRKERFNLLLEQCEKYQRINQFSYAARQQEGDLFG